MSDSLTIASTQSDRKLVFSKFDGQNFYVSLFGTVTCSVPVDGYALHSEKVSEWLQILSKYRTPWDGQLRWSSLETEIEILASCSSLGAVNFEVNLWVNAGAEEETQIKTFIVSELGQLEKLGKEANAFFNK